MQKRKSQLAITKKEKFFASKDPLTKNRIQNKKENVSIGQWINL